MVMVMVMVMAMMMMMMIFSPPRYQLAERVTVILKKTGLSNLAKAQVRQKTFFTSLCPTNGETSIKTESQVNRLAALPGPSLIIIIIIIIIITNTTVANCPISGACFVDCSS